MTDYDIRKVLASSDGDILAMSVSEVVEDSPEAALSDVKAVEAFAMMRQRDKPAAVLPVVDRSGAAVGMIHLNDLIEVGL